MNQVISVALRAKRVEHLAKVQARREAETQKIVERLNKVLPKIVSDVREEVTRVYLALGSVKEVNVRVSSRYLLPGAASKCADIMEHAIAKDLGIEHTALSVLIQFYTPRRKVLVTFETPFT